jgi:putative Holliday junction resolvase
VTPPWPGVAAGNSEQSRSIAGAGRVLGIDLGAVRCGVALSDSSQCVASPLVTLPRSADLPQTLARLASEEEAVGIVIGLPLSLDGSIGPAARAVLDEVDALSEVAGVPVELHDERFTTVTAARSLQGGGKGGRRTRQARQLVDQVAAAVMLQSWLDGRGA